MQNRTNRNAASTIARSAAACLTLAFVGWFAPSSDAPAAQPTSVESARPATQIAGLLVPKRTRIVIKFERTAVC